MPNSSATPSRTPGTSIGTGALPIGETALVARAPAPDLARGAMLLLIALANAHLYLYHRPIGVRGYPVVESILDQVVVLVQMACVDGRAYPMFALLFGYGMVQWLHRLTTSGVDPETVRRLIRRRGWWLLLFGFLHALLLFAGDVIGAYGLLAVLLAGWVIRLRDRALLLVVALWTILATAFGALQNMPVPESAGTALPSMSSTDPLLAAGRRVTEWSALTVIFPVLGLLPALLLGVWAARRRLLDEPERCRRVLRRAAVLGVALAVLGGLPLALMANSWWPQPSLTALLLAGAAHALTGYAGGVGYAAIAGLIAVRARGRRGRLSTALVAVGQRSMTCYLLQSVVFVATLAAYGGGLGDRLGLATTAALAVATWALTVLLATLMARRGVRGPAEVILRRLTYASVSR